ncbi:glutathione S-transferase family protein [Alteromonadaceae bacterium M269]|nr:glutathione S-transferase family protein [Alteromonadaceae bacterium M269]
MIKIVSFKICPFVQRVTALLEAKKITYDIEYIDLSDKPDWFLEMSPNGQVPILITDDNQVLFESDAIVEYIEEVTEPSLLSPDPVQKAQDRAWSYLASKNYLVQCSAQRSTNQETLTERASKLATAFAKIETKLGDARYINGDSLSIVDISWLPLLHRANIIEQNSGFDFLSAFPKVKRWQNTMLETDLAEKSVPEDFEDRFISFYLSDSTYLGQLTKKNKDITCSNNSECKPVDMLCCS